MSTIVDSEVTLGKLARQARQSLDAFDKKGNSGHLIDARVAMQEIARHGGDLTKYFTLAEIHSVEEV